MESKKRTAIKALSYRALVTSILLVVSWIFTSDIGQTTLITVVYAALATVGYYGHERVWLKVRWQTRKKGGTSPLPSSLTPHIYAKCQDV